MTPVKEIVIALLGNDVIYKLQKDHDETMAKRKREWKKIFIDIEDILSKFYITSDTCQFIQSDNILSIVVTDNFSFENAVELLRSFEEDFKVVEFNYNAESDKLEEQEPFARYCIEPKKQI